MESKEQETRERIELELYTDSLKEQGITDAWKHNLKGFAEEEYSSIVDRAESIMKEQKQMSIDRVIEEGRRHQVIKEESKKVHSKYKTTSTTELGCIIEEDEETKQEWLIY